MTRTRFEHAIRAAGGVLDVDEVIVIGIRLAGMDPTAEGAEAPVERHFVVTNWFEEPRARTRGSGNQERRRITPAEAGSASVRARTVQNPDRP